VFSAPGWHRGVVGIAASRLVERYSRPVFVLGEEDGVANGSGRSIPQFHLLNALESMADLFTKFGGHRQAAGVTLPASRVAEFRERLAAYARERLTPDDLKPSLALDLETDFRELTDDAVAEVLAMAPFGFGNPKPVAAVYGVEIAAAPELKNERHLFLRLRQGGRLLMAKWWNFAPNGAGGSQLGPAAALNGLEQGNRLDVAFTLEEDRYSASRGFAPWQIVLRAIRPA
jgi:single-stranded-DNA-specific exonuclease